MPKTESGTKRTSKQIEEKKGLVVAGENPTAGSTDLPSIIELEKSPSVSLIDDSVKQLHGLMKLIGDDVTKGQDAKEGIRPTDLAKADSVVRIATAMQKLIKTKVDAFKVVHR